MIYGQLDRRLWLEKDLKIQLRLRTAWQSEALEANFPAVGRAGDWKYFLIKKSTGACENFEWISGLGEWMNDNVGAHAYWVSPARREHVFQFSCENNFSCAENGVQLNDKNTCSSSCENGQVEIGHWTWHWPCPRTGRWTLHICSVLILNFCGNLSACVGYLQNSIFGDIFRFFLACIFSVYFSTFFDTNRDRIPPALVCLQIVDGSHKSTRLTFDRIPATPLNP